MQGFESPNHTQVPNDLFEKHLRNMKEAELKVILALMRQTLGYHREKVIFSITKICQMTGLSHNGVTSGARSAQKHGFVKRINNPEDRTSAEWELVIRIKQSSPSPSEGMFLSW
jgi:DNA-binding MarR family transcriptional regulator